MITERSRPDSVRAARNLIRSIHNLLKQELITAAGRTYPNPVVACVIVAETKKSNSSGESGIMLISGATEPAGKRHAEIVAFDRFDRRLAELSAEAQKSIRIHSVYVTLEPCSRTGRTPPCTDRIQNYAVRRLKILYRDPSLNGEGIHKLAARKIPASIFRLKECVTYGFNYRLENRRPVLHIKTAMFAGNCTGLRTKRLPVSGKKALSFGMLLRSRCDAVLAGASTLITDRASLTVRPADARESLKPEPQIPDDSMAGLILNHHKEILDELNQRRVQPRRIIWATRYSAALEKELLRMIRQTGSPAAEVTLFYLTENVKALQTDDDFQKLQNISPELKTEAAGSFSEMLNRIAESGINHLLVEPGRATAVHISALLTAQDFIYRLLSKKSRPPVSSQEECIFIDDFWSGCQKLAEYDLEDDLLQVYRG